MENINVNKEKTSDDLHMLYEGLLEFESRLEKIKIEIDNLLDGCYSLKKCSFFKELIKKAEENEVQKVSVPLEEDKNDELLESFELQTKYFGSPSGAGFEQSHQLSSKDNPKTLFVIEQIASNKARFYPMKEKFYRLKLNFSSLLEPVCSVQGNLMDSSDFIVEENGYGQLDLEDNYWKVTQKCVIKCSD